MNDQEEEIQKSWFAAYYQDLFSAQYNPKKKKKKNTAQINNVNHFLTYWQQCP